MKTISVIAFTVALCLTALHAQSVPAFVNYQGNVTDSNGVGLGTGTPINRIIVFRIYDAATGGAVLWTEQHTVALANGEFSVLLGNGAAFSVNSVQQIRPPLDTVFTGANRYIGITVDNGSGTIDGSDTEIAPRQRITSTAYSLRAGTAAAVAYGTDLGLRDSNHGLGWYGVGRPFSGQNIDGPVLYGFSGGALGSNQNGVEKTALWWNGNGNVGIGGAPTTTAALGVNGVLGISDGGNRVVNSGISSEFNGGLIQFGANDGSTNRFGGTYDSAKQGGFFRVDTRSSDPLFSFHGRNANSNGNPGRVASISSSGALTASGTVTGGSLFTAGSITGGSITISGTVTGANLTTPGTVTGGNLTTSGAVTAASLSTSGAISAGGQSTFSGGLKLFDSAIALRGDVHHGLKFSSPIDGPILYGFQGGALATQQDAGDPNAQPPVAPNPPIIALEWNAAGDVDVTRDVYVTRNISMGGDVTAVRVIATGDITSNGKNVPVAEEKLRIVRGTINSNGTIKHGSGFTVTGTNDYTITFPAGTFSGVPSITATSVTSGYLIITLNSISTTGFKAQSRLSDNNNYSAGDFSFIAVGPR